MFIPSTFDDLHENVCLKKVVYYPCNKQGREELVISFSRGIPAYFVYTGKSWKNKMNTILVTKEIQDFLEEVLNMFLETFEEAEYYSMQFDET